MSLVITLHLLAQARQEREELLAQAEALECALAKLPEYAALTVAQEALNRKGKEVAQLESEVREFAIGSYQESGDKHPVPGVTIKVFTKVRYDMGEALAWCKENAKAFVREMLDTKSFDKVAPNMAGAPVEVVTEPRPYIDADLSAYLKAG